MKNLGRSFLLLILASMLSSGAAGQARAATAGLDASGLDASGTSGDRNTVGNYMDDVWITARVKALLLKDEGVKALDVKVETRKGLVQLGGRVDSPTPIALAEKIARGVEGVRGIQNNLQVKR